ncbi:MAG: hypothetical protein IJT83_01595, partial [Victivallales bacterium]|nr:hypothetical protein [Victivallales bacterium]
VTAVFSEDTAQKLYSLDGGESWLDYTDGVIFESNGNVLFKAVDAAGNEALSEAVVVSNIDTVAPETPVASADVTKSTNQPVTVTAVFSEDSSQKLYSLDGGESWLDYTDGVVFEQNGSIVFKAVDAAGNEALSEAFAVDNILTAIPDSPEVTVKWDEELDSVIATATYDESQTCLFSVNGGEWQRYESPVAIHQDENISFKTVDAAGNESETTECNVAVALKESDFATAANAGSVQTTWTNEGVAAWAEQYDVQLVVDAEKQVLLEGVNGQGIEVCNADGTTLSLSVKPSQSNEWTDGGTVEVPASPEEVVQVQADTNGLTDVLMVRAHETWGAFFIARHVGVGDWEGTNETISLSGKNRIKDIYAGSDDSTVLLLTDDENGDALFVDDIYSAFPDGSDAVARLAKLDEIRAGAGNDIIDLTSQRFDYNGKDMTVKGGAGNDTIWANQGANWLFGDTGNDRLVGAGGDDMLAGGAGDDSIHGGGGNDIIAFGGSWGNDTVEQKEGGTLLLWFDGIEQGDLDISAGANGDLVFASEKGSVTIADLKYDDVKEVFGTRAAEFVGGISLKFGDDGSELYQNLLRHGAFADSTSETIYENKSRGMLA